MVTYAHSNCTFREKLYLHIIPIYKIFMIQYDIQTNDNYKIEAAVEKSISHLKQCYIF